MSAHDQTSFRTRLLAGCAGLAMFCLAPSATANVARIQFSGTYNFGTNVGVSFSGAADLTLQADPAASATFPAIPGPVPSGPRVDPAGAQIITGATGTFNGHAITGVQMTNGAPPPPGEYLPASYSFLVASNTPDGTPAVSFDNLFYVSGSPLTCIGINPDGSTTPLYPFAGGVFDLYGVLFTLDNGDLLDVWSNGVMPGLGLNYGAILLAPAEQNYAVLSAQFNGVALAVPEPDFLWLFGAGILALFTRGRSVEGRVRASGIGR